MTQRALDRQPPFRTKPPRRAPPKLASKVAPQVARLAAKSGAMDPALAERWEEAAGPDLAPLCRPVRMIRRGKAVSLEVSVATGAAAMRLQYAQNALLARLRTHLREPRLTTLTIKQSGAPSREDKPRWASRRVTAEPMAVAETPAQRPAKDLAEALDRLRASMRPPPETS